MLRALTLTPRTPHLLGAFRVWAMAAAFAAIGASLAHLVLLASPEHGAHGVLAVAMAVSCAVCATRCLHRPCARELKALLAMAVGMVFIHLVIIAVPTRLGVGHNHTLSSASSADSSLALAGMVLMEIVVAGLCAAGLRTARQPQPHVERGA